MFLFGLEFLTSTFLTDLLTGCAMYLLMLGKLLNESLFNTEDSYNNIRVAVISSVSSCGMHVSGFLRYTIEWLHFEQSEMMLIKGIHNYVCSNLMTKLLLIYFVVIFIPSSW